ncbi:hypothetical protein EW145_g7875 [Phellinidium pouzarii]|uniref:Uncharacterized protein n=1 Tax=Phellinidium pouzarii TaxID=167371 RepID=A0A4S4KHE9_9AGAM|nr:hypothetical protein EW145_g7875 [Phellinidium pouzarii]
MLAEPKESPKPQPIGNFAFISLFTICTVCAFFILWHRANSLRSVVAHQLKTWTRGEGHIRLSEDDGPPSHSFVEDDEDEDVDDEEPLAARMERLRSASESTTPPVLPPKDLRSGIDLDAEVSTAT